MDYQYSEQASSVVEYFFMPLFISLLSLILLGYTIKKYYF